MRVRLATIKDREAIARLHTDSWHEAFSKFAPELVKARGNQFLRRYAQWGELLQNDALFTYVAVENGQVVGFGQGGSVRSELDLVDYDGELVRLYVSPKHHGKGIGKSLINKVARILEERGCESLVVVAWSINTPARRFYEHLGAQYLKEIVQEWRGFNNSQTVYGWENIHTAIEESS